MYVTAAASGTSVLLEGYRKTIRIIRSEIYVNILVASRRPLGCAATLSRSSLATSLHNALVQHLVKSLHSATSRNSVEEAKSTCFCRIPETGRLIKSNVTQEASQEGDGLSCYCICFRSHAQGANLAYGLALKLPAQ